MTEHSKLLWNGNEIVYEDNPNSGIAGIAPDQPDALAQLIVDSANNAQRYKEALEALEELWGGEEGYQKEVAAYKELNIVSPVLYVWNKARDAIKESDK